MKLEVDPGDYNAYWSNQFGFAGSPVGGYVGFQTHADGNGMFLGSVWDATSASAGSPGTYCTDFGGEGKGKSCRMNERPIAGHQYKMTVSKSGSHGWTFTVADETANTTVTLGTIDTATDMKLSSTDFVSWAEYFDWNDPNTTCSQAAYSKVLFGNPETSEGAGEYTKPDTRKRCPEMERVTFGPDGATHENGPMPGR